MKGVVFEKAGDSPKIIDSLEKPKPLADQILVKSLYTAINPVDSYMSGTGLLVTAWPFVLGCDAAGVVVEVGDKASSKFKVGDEVCGCTRLGVPGHSTGQEYFLMDAPLTIPKPKNLSIQQAATIGVGAETACLGIFNGLAVDMPSLDSLPEEKDEWIVVLGGASSVGKYGIQIAKAAGYKVVASCSSKSASLVQDLGADPFDYKKSVEDQVKDVMSLTDGKARRVFDAAATGDSFAKALFKELSDGPKYFSTTNDWAGITSFEGGTTYIIALGEIGREGAKELNADLEKFIPFIVGLIEQDKIEANAFDIVGNGGFEDVIEALKYQQKGAGGSNKVLVKIQNK